MNTQNILFSSSLDNYSKILIANLLTNSTISAADALAQFSENSDFAEQISLIFNASIHNLNLNWKSDNFTFPEIKIVSSEQINGANGAFSSQTNIIYLSQEFLLVNQSNINIVTSVILEEYGHYLDSQLDSVDTPGDEGAFFSAVVRGEELSDRDLQELQNEDDTAVVTLDAETVVIEQNIEDIVLFDRMINANENDEFNFSFQTADYANRWLGTNIQNDYSYSSGNDLIQRINIPTQELPITAGFEVGVARAGATGGLRIEPSSFDVGLDIAAGYGLGEFSFDFGMLGASVDARIQDGRLSVDFDTHIALPEFNYASPYAFATVDAVVGYDLEVDAFLRGTAQIGVNESSRLCDNDLLRSICRTVNRFVEYTYETQPFDTNLLNERGEYSHRLVNLDTRDNNNFIDYVVDRVDFDGGQGGVSRQRTGGIGSLDLELPSFENTFTPLFGNNVPGDLTDILSNDQEFVWEISDETTLAEANLSIDGLLAKIPILAFLSQTGGFSFEAGGVGFGLSYDWQALGLELSSSLNLGYSFKLGITDLLPEFNTAESEIADLDFDFDGAQNLEELIPVLVELDADNGNDIDLALDFDPTIIFEAEAYLMPEVGLNWDVAQFDAAVEIAGREFGLGFDAGIEGGVELGSTRLDIIPTTREEVKLSDVLDWLNLDSSVTQFNLELPFSRVAPDRFGSSGDDFFAGSPGNDIFMAGEGNDRMLFSAGLDMIDGDDGIDSLVLDRGDTYTATNAIVTDTAGNQTEFVTTELLELAGDQATAGFVVVGNATSLEVAGIGSEFGDTIQTINVENLQSGGGNDLIEANWTGSSLELGSGNDTATLTKRIDPSDSELTIDTGEGDDTLNLTIIPVNPAEIQSPSITTIDLAGGNDTATVVVGEPVAGNTTRRSIIEVKGYAGGNTVNAPLNAANVNSEVILSIDASELRQTFGIEEDTSIDGLFATVSDSNIQYSLDDTNPEAPTVQDEIIQADKVTLDIIDSGLPTSVKVNLENLNADILNVESHNSPSAEVVLDVSELTDLANAAVLEVNGDYASVKVEQQDETTLAFLESNLTGEFRSIDFSSIEGGVMIDGNFIPPDNADELDVSELILSEEADIVLLSPDSSAVSESSTEFNQRLIGIENFMLFELGAGDDIFHDRPGERDSDIIPGSGNDFIYGAGGYDTVLYQEGSRLDYEITVVDDRTIEVLYRPDNTTDTLVDVEEVDFDGADADVFNPFWQAPNIVPEGSYTTFTLQVFARDDWNQPPFIYAPWSSLVPVGTTEVTLTEEFLLGNIVDPEGSLAGFEISDIDVFAEVETLTPSLDTTNPDADIWEVSIPESLTNEEEAVRVIYTVDTPSGSSQGNELYLYPSHDIDYSIATEAINITTSEEPETLSATPFDDVINSNAGNDVVEGRAGNDLLQGGNGDDYLNGNQGNDTIEGGNGNDGLIDGLEDGSDFYDGGEGIDTLSYDETDIALSADLQEGIISVGEVEQDTVINVENLIGGSSADDITGDEVDNLLNGLGGNDSLVGGGGNDTLEGRDGDDSLEGGVAEDFLLGGTGNDILIGGADIDVLEANEGNDTLSGGTGGNLLMGGVGNDTYIFNLDTSRGDIIDEEGGDSDVVELFTADNEPVILSLQSLSAGEIGIARMENSFILDLNRDGIASVEDDLLIFDYFGESSNKIVEQVANLESTDIINFLT